MHEIPSDKRRIARNLFRAEAALAAAVLLLFAGLYWSTSRRERYLARLRLLTDYSRSFETAALDSRLYVEEASSETRARRARDSGRVLERQFARSGVLARTLDRSEDVSDLDQLQRFVDASQKLLGRIETLRNAGRPEEAARLYANGIVPLVDGYLAARLEESLASQEAERQDFLRDLQDFSRLSYLCAVGAAVLCFALFALWTRRVVDYLLLNAESLKRGMAAVASGNFHLHLPAGREDGSSDLLRALNEMAARLEATQRRVVEIERLAAFGQLASGAAHALNNPLAAVIGYAELLLQRKGLDEKTMEDLRVVRDQARRCDAILRNLRQFGARAGGEKRPVRVDEILERLSEFLRPTLDAFGTSLELRLEAGLPPVLANPQELQQVFYNLLINAHQAVQSTPDPRIRVVTRRSEDNLVVAVEDNGEGISREHLARLFEPFFTTRPSPQGLGLGLSSAYGIVRAHGGEIKVSSEPGKGSRFEVSLPLTFAAVAPPAPARGRVLVVDDEVDLLNIVGRLLRREGFQVECVSSAAAALQSALQNPYDVILADYRMSGMDGVQLFEAVRNARRGAAARFIFSTGELVAPDFQTFASKHGIPVLLKPFDLDEMVSVVRARASSAASPRAAA